MPTVQLPRRQQSQEPRQTQPQHWSQRSRSAQPRTVQTCNLGYDEAAQLFALLNPKAVYLKHPHPYSNVYVFEMDVPTYPPVFGTGGGVLIITDLDPDRLVYPEGWYYEDGCLCNQRTNTTGTYVRIPMLTPRGQSWRELASYCTLA